MSAIGRIFLILNLVLAAVFLGFAANQLTQQTNVTAKLTTEQAAHAASKTSLGEQIAGLTTQVNQLKTDTSTLRDERDQQKLLADRNGQDLAHEKEANAQLRGELTGIRETLGGYNSTIASLNSEKDRLVKEKDEAFTARDAATAAQMKADQARRDAELALTKANGNIDQLGMDLASSAKLALALDTELKTVYAATKYPRVGTPQPLVEGAVLGIDNSIKPGLLAINKGSADNVTRGMVFDLYTGNTYKGRARVELVKENVCSALVIMAVDGAPIAQGDRATTQL
jgi:hypothetical protein